MTAQRIVVPSSEGSSS